MRSTDELDQRAAAAARRLAASAETPAPDARTAVERFRGAPVEPYDLPLRRPGRAGRAVTAIAAAVAVLVAGAVTVAVRSDENASTAPASTSTSTVPPEQGRGTGRVSIFSADGSPRDVAAAYLRSRFPLFPTPGVRIESVVEDHPVATARWSTSDGPGQPIASGAIRLRRAATQWSVVGSTTDGVELDLTTSPEGRLRGSVASSNGNALAVDVLDLAGNPVPGSPHPDGYPGTGSPSHRIGTAGIDGRRVELDLPVEGGVIVQARLVGGTILAIAEHVVDTSPRPSTIAEGTWKGGTWRLLVGIARSRCGWLEVNGVRDAPLCAPPDAEPQLVRLAATYEDESLWMAMVGPSVHQVRLVVDTTTSVESDTIAAPDGLRLAVLPLPREAQPVVTLLGADGGPLPLHPPTLRFGEAVPLLAAEMSVERSDGVTFVRVRLDSLPARHALWLLVLVDGRVAGASQPLIVGSTFGTRVELEGVDEIRAVVADGEGNVVAAISAHPDELLGSE